MRQAKQSLLRRCYNRASCALLALFEWAIAKLVALLETPRATKTGPWPGETTHDYNFEIVAKHARRHGTTLSLGGLVLLLAFFAYLSVDALWLHNHGLVVVPVGAPLHDRTLAARRALNESELLGMFRNDSDLRPARNFPEYRSVDSCAEIDALQLMEHAGRYLTANEGRERCCCAPMLGVDANFIALYRSDDKPLYMFNVVDHYRDDYDALSAQSHSQQLHVVTHSQAALFASAPEPVRVLRRAKLRLDAMQHVGAVLHVEVDGSDAFCVEECIDLIRGISAVQRAAMQKANGINV